MNKRKLKKLIKKRFLPEISLTPLIDAVLVLLIIFMIAMPIMQSAINIELPESATDDTPVKKKRDSISVSVNKKKEIFINNIKVTKIHLIDELEKKLKNSQDIVVFVEGDKFAPYGTILEVLDDIKYLAGVKYVALSTQSA